MTKSGLRRKKLETATDTEGDNKRIKPSTLGTENGDLKMRFYYQAMLRRFLCPNAQLGAQKL